jgi:hypothetical protein
MFICVFVFGRKICLGTFKKQIFGPTVGEMFASWVQTATGSHLVQLNKDKQCTPHLGM